MRGENKGGKKMTELAKILKSIRLGNGQILKNMSDALNVTSSYLSAVENGKRPMPEEWIEKLKKAYGLSSEMLDKIADAADELRVSIKMNLDNATQTKKEAAVVFARSFEDMDDQTAKSIINILQGKR